MDRYSHQKLTNEFNLIFSRLHDQFLSYILRHSTEEIRDKFCKFLDSAQWLTTSTPVSPANYSIDCPTLINHHPGGPIGQIVAEVPSGLRLTPPQGN
jgi:hypothetical protein